MQESYEIRVKKRNYLTIAMVLVVLSVGGLVFSVFLFDVIVEQIIKYSAPFKPGASTRNFFLNVPFPLEFHCHVFNIQNPEAVQNGAKPILKDIGPYVFDEYIFKHDTVDDEVNDTLTYTMKKTWIFNPELSNGLTGEEQITILHPVLNSIALAVMVDQKGIIGMVSKALDQIFEPKTPFWTGRAMDLLFDGIEFDCTGTTFAVESVCEYLNSDDIASMQKVPNKKGFLQFSLLGAYNDSSNGRFTVLRGKKNIHDIGRIVAIDGKPKTDKWLTDEANQYKGTDGYFMPPLLTHNDKLYAFERMFCISVGLEYDRKQYVRGIPMPTYSTNLKSFASDKAYCRKNGSCPIEGTIDLFNCMKAPIIATLPHFLYAHPSLLGNIESGLTPNRRDHEMFASVDPQTGLPVFAMKRLQFNFEVIPVPEVEVMKNLRSLVFPFAWIEERAKLPLPYALAMHWLFFTRLAVSLTKYLCMSLVPLAAIVSLSIHFLISVDQIQVVDRPKHSVMMTEVIEVAEAAEVAEVTEVTEVAEVAAENVFNHVDEIEVSSAKKSAAGSSGHDSAVVASGENSADVSPTRNSADISSARNSAVVSSAKNSVTDPVVP